MSEQDKIKFLELQIEKMRGVLEFFADEGLYSMTEFRTAATLYDVSEGLPRAVIVKGNPILHLGLEKAVNVLMEIDKMNDSMEKGDSRG